jgi:cobalt-zinc-cadmium efflux system outer membrane protein
VDVPDASPGHSIRAGQLSDLWDEAEARREVQPSARNTVKRPLLVLALGGSACLALAVGCVPADAGYGDVRRIVATRTGHDVRWQEHEGSVARDPMIRQLVSKPLSADGAVQLALLNNAGLQAAFEELGVARAELVKALRLPNPTADAALRFHGAGSVRAEIDVQAQLDLTEIAFLPLRGGVGQARLEAAKLSVAAQVLDLAFETRVAFYRYQAAVQTLELDRNILAALRASFEAAERLHEAGNITALRFANERALYEEARLAHARAEVALGVQRQELATLLGLWKPDAEWTTEPRLGAPVSSEAGLADLEARAVEKSLDLEILRFRYEAAGKAANLASARGWVPELRAGVAAEREHDDNLGWTVGPAVSLEVPLFYQGQGERGAALADLRRQKQLHIETAVRIRATARALATRLQAAVKSVEYYEKELLPLREQIVNDTQLEYNAMSAGVFQLLEAKRAQIAAARAYVELLRDYWVARAEADELLAGRLPSRSSLQQPEGDSAGDTRSQRSDTH